MPIAMTLHAHQAKALDMIRDALRRGKRRVMLKLPTGAGKTVIAADIIDKAHAKGNKVLFVVPRLELIDQTIERFAANGITDIGVIQARHRLTNPDKPIQIASMQTLATRKLIPAGIKIAIIDEAHLWSRHYGVKEVLGHDTVGRPISEMRGWFADADYPIIGLSATPWSRGLGDWYEDLIQPVSIQELIDAGFLAPFRVYAPSHPDLSGVKEKVTTTGEKDYDEGGLADVMCGRQLVADVVDTWLQLGENRSTLCFCVNRPHAKFLHERFVAAGVACGYIDCETPDAERRELRDAFAAGDLKIVCNVDVLGIGVDWDVRCMILARPTRSLIRHVQTIGRGLRTAEGKDWVIILDHGDSHLRLGLVTDIDGGRLKGGNRKERVVALPTVPLPRECMACHFLIPAGTRRCPACGAEHQVEAAEVFTTDGVLALFTENKALLAARRKKSRGWSLEEKARFFGELLYYANMKGWKHGWAANKFRERLGVWPNAVARARPIPPTLDTTRWIRDEQKRWFETRKGMRRYAAKGADYG